MFICGVVWDHHIVQQMYRVLMTFGTHVPRPKIWVKITQIVFKQRPFERHQVYSEQLHTLKIKLTKQKLVKTFRYTYLIWLTVFMSNDNQKTNKLSYLCKLFTMNKITKQVIPGVEMNTQFSMLEGDEVDSETLSSCRKDKFLHKRSCFLFDGLQVLLLSGVSWVYPEPTIANGP